MEEKAKRPEDAHWVLSWVFRGLAALTLTGGSLLLGTRQRIFGVVLLCLGVLFVWCANREMVHRCRALAEREWWRLRRAGEFPDPLVPCCILADVTGGAVHDDARCTRDRVDEMFYEIAYRLEEDPGESDR